MTPRRCVLVNRQGLRCRHEKGHAGPHEAGAPDPEDLDDPSDDVLEHGAQRDADERRDRGDD